MGPSSANPFPEHRYRAAPKAELHVHLEGSVGPETLLALAHAHGVAPPAEDVEGIRRWFTFESFHQFLKRYLFVCSLLRSPEDFRRIARDYLAQAHGLGAVHIEFHVSTCVHIVESKLAWTDVLAGIVAGCEEAEEECGISSLLIPDISPHLDVQRCSEALDAILGERHTRVVALGMGGPASHWMESDFAPLFERARAGGLRAVSHAAEHGPVSEMRHALDRFGAERIQHGIRALDDPEVADELRAKGVACDVCPGSNVALGAVESIESHPLPRLVGAGIPVTLGSDDPPMFHTDLLNEYRLAWEGCGLREEALDRIALASIEHSFAPESKRARWRAAWERWAAEPDWS